MDTLLTKLQFCWNKLLVEFEWVLEIINCVIIWTHVRYNVMPRVCTNLRTTLGLFKKWRHEALYNEGFCLDIRTTRGYFELLCLSLECAFIKIWSDPNPNKTTQNHQREKTKQNLQQISQWITKWCYYVAWLWYCQLHVVFSFHSGLTKIIYSEVVLGSIRFYLVLCFGVNTQWCIRFVLDKIKR